MRSELKRAMGAVLKSYRLKRNVAQEGMGASQSYISNLERGRWNASIDKIEQMAAVLNVHPVSIVLAAYLTADTVSDRDETLERVKAELREIGL